MEYLTASYYSSLDTAVELLASYSSSKKDILKYTRCEKGKKNVYEYSTVVYFFTDFYVLIYFYL